MSVKCVPPQTPLLYSKTGVFRGIPYFLIFAPKHRLWAKIRKISKKFSADFFSILKLKKYLFIALASFRNVWKMFY